MKRGFTLAETLITLVIIGIVTMLVLPAVIKSKPDEAKVEYLKTEKTLAHIIKKLAHDTRRYPACDNSNCYRNYPLYNNLVRNAAGNTVQSDTKLCELIAESLEVDNQRSCQNANALPEFTNAAPQAWSFRTKDGKDFYVGEHRTQEDYYAEIVFDLNRADKEHCLYDDNCTNPGRFKLWVTADGDIQIGDSMGDAYYKSSKSWLRREYAPQAVERRQVPVILDRGCDCDNNSHCTATGECECNEGLRRDTDGMCKKCLDAERNACTAAGKTMDADSCECVNNGGGCSEEELAAGKVFINGACQCPAGMLEEGGSCINIPDDCKITGYETIDLTQTFTETPYQNQYNQTCYRSKLYYTYKLKDQDTNTTKCQKLAYIGNMGLYTYYKDYYDQYKEQYKALDNSWWLLSLINQHDGFAQSDGSLPAFDATVAHIYNNKYKPYVTKGRIQCIASYKKLENGEWTLTDLQYPVEGARGRCNELTDKEIYYDYMPSDD